jgi:hypothetical protein
MEITNVKKITQIFGHFFDAVGTSKLRNRREKKRVTQ